MERTGTNYMAVGGAPLLVGAILLAATGGLHAEAARAYGRAWGLFVATDVGMLLTGAGMMLAAVLLPSRRAGWFLRGAGATGTVASVLSVCLGVAALLA